MKENKIKVNYHRYLCVIRFFVILFTIFSFFACKPKNARVPIQHINADTIKTITIIYNEVLPIEDYNDHRVSTKIKSSHTKSLYLSTTSEYSSGFKKNIGSINNYYSIDSLSIKLKYYTKKKLKDVKLVWTIDDENGKNLTWNGSLVNGSNLNTWEDLFVGFKLNKLFTSEKNILNIYIWNPGKEELWVDDFEFSLIGKKNKSQQLIYKNNTNFYYDFESPQDLVRTETIKESDAHSGKMTCNFSNGEEYGIGVVKNFKDFGNEIIKKLSASIWVFPMESKHDLVLVFSSVDKVSGEVKYWYGKSTMNGDCPLNKWTLLNSSINLPTEKFNLNDVIEVGLWNKGKTSILCDDLHIVYGEQPERREEDRKPNLNLKHKNTQLEHLNEFQYQPILLDIDSTNVDAFASYNPIDKIISGLFYEPQIGLESLLHIKKERAKLLCYNSKLNKFDVIWETKDKNHLLLQPNNAFFSGDFNGDHVCDLLVVNKANKTWEIYHFLQNTWSIVTNGANPFPIDLSKDEMNISECKNINSDKKSVLLEINTNSHIAFKLMNNSWTSKKMDVKGIKKDDVIMDWNDNRMFKFNSQWRFELNEVELKNEEFVSSKSVDFKMNKKGINPKYYEYTRLLSGNFTSKQHKQLMIFYFNCANVDYKGNNCSEIERNAEFPNGIALYH